MARGMVVELESERDFKKAMVLLTRQRSFNPVWHYTEFERSNWFMAFELSSRENIDEQSFQ